MKNIDVKWWEPLIATVPIALVGLSSDMMQNFGSFVGAYLIMFAVIYVLKYCLTAPTMVTK